MTHKPQRRRGGVAAVAADSLAQAQGRGTSLMPTQGGQTGVEGPLLPGTGAGIGTVEIAITITAVAAVLAGGPVTTIWGLARG